MKNKLLLITLSILLFAFCKKDVPITGNCLQLGTKPNWTTVNFKAEYTIQFSSDYEGQGMVGFEGNTFYKWRVDKKVRMNYSFCSPLWCDDFGNDLDNPNSSSITITEPNGQQLILDKRKNLCNNNTTVGIYYYTDNAYSVGKLFWKRDNKYQEALTVHYEKEFQNEVEQILKTIRTK